MVNDITMENMQPGGMPEDDCMHVVMFYGTTCGPCKATMPHYEDISNHYEKLDMKIKFHRIDAWTPEEQAEYCKEVWEIQGVPTFKIFYGGHVLHNHTGGGDYKKLHEIFEFCINRIKNEFNQGLQNES